MSCDCNCNPCCPSEDNGNGAGGQGFCTVCGPFQLGSQEMMREVWSTSNGAFVPGTVIIKLFQDGSSNNAIIQGTVQTPGGPVTFPVPPITPGNSYAETFPAINRLTISKAPGSGPTVSGEFCICVGQLG